MPGLPVIKLFAWTRWLVVAAVLAALLLATVLLAYAAVASVTISWDILYLGGGIALVIGALALSGGSALRKR